MEHQTGFKSGKKYIKAVYCHPAYLTSMQSTSCKVPDWMKNQLEMLDDLDIVDKHRALKYLHCYYIYDNTRF